MATPHWLDTPLVHALGWMLAHTLWQAAGAALLIRLIWITVSHQRARARYALALIAMAVVLAGAISTFGLYYRTYQPVVVNALAETISTLPFPEIVETAAPDLAVENIPIDPVAEKQANTPFLTGVLYAVESYLPWLVLVWLFGTALMGLRLAGGWFRLRRLSRTGLAPLPPEWAERFRRLAKRMDVRRPAQLRLSRIAAEPITFQHLKPIILFPVGLINQLNVEQVEAILLHELAHIRRWDYLVNWLQSILELLFFYHPAVWWLSGQVREAREHCCDDLALRQGGARPLLYAQTLTQLTALSFHQQTKLAMSAKGINGTFTQRVKRLFGHEETVGDWRKPVLSALVCLTILLSFTFSSRAIHEPPAGSLLDALLFSQEAPSSFPAEDKGNDQWPVTSGIPAPAGMETTFVLPHLDTVPAPSGRIAIRANQMEIRKSAGGIEWIRYTDRPEMGGRPEAAIPLSIDALILDLRGNPSFSFFDEDARRLTSPAELQSLDPGAITVIRSYPAAAKPSDAGNKGPFPAYLITAITREDTLRFPDYDQEFQIFTQRGLERFTNVATGQPSRPAVPETSIPSEQSDQPLYVIDGKVVGRDTSGLKNFDPDDILSVNVLKGPHAVARYGPEAQSGVIEVVTKNGAARIFEKSPAADTIQPVFPDGFREELFMRGLTVRNPIYIVNGENWGRDAEKVKTLQIKDIEKMDVLRGEAAMEIYGEEGRYGVLVIERKKKDQPEENRSGIRISGRGVDPFQTIPPMYVIDGIRWVRDRKAVRDLDPGDIESIEVIKREEAVKEYGDEGRHGVVRIVTKSKSYAPIIPREPLYVVNGRPIPATQPWREVKSLDFSRLGFLSPQEAMKKYGPSARHGAVLLQYTQGSGQWNGSKPYLPLDGAPLHEDIAAQLKAPNVEQYFIDGALVSRQVFTQFNHLHFAPKGTVSFRRVGKILGARQQNANLEKIRKQYAGQAFVYELGPGIVAVEFYRDCENTIPIGLIYSSFGQDILQAETIYKNGIRASTPPAKWRIKCGEGEAEATPTPVPTPPALGPEVNTALHVARQIKGTFRAYPNPFQQETTLAFELSESIQARISVFSANGQLMKILVDNETLAAGRHEFVWNAGRAPGGSYVVMIEAGGSRITQTIQKQ